MILLTAYRTPAIADSDEENIITLFKQGKGAHTISAMLQIPKFRIEQFLREYRAVNGLLPRQPRYSPTVKMAMKKRFWQLERDLAKEFEVPVRFVREVLRGKR